eukprot:6113725-Lingulodinium_polyedra.AAC.1
MPRVPAVFEIKLRWRKLDETPFIPDFPNYKSVGPAVDHLEQQMVDEQSLGVCFKCSEDELRA